MAELAENYSDFITGMARKAGIPDQDVPDAVQYILERLAKTDVIGQYKPDHLVTHQGQAHTTKFSTFLGAKVLLYCRGERGRVQRRKMREIPVSGGTSEADEGGLSALLGALAPVEDDHSRLDAEEMVAALRTRLAAVPRRSKRDTCDLAALFDEIVAEIEADGEFTYAGICARFDISGTTAGMWLSRLRSALGAALGRPLAVIGGVALTHEQIAAAVKILREAPGIMVAQPLRRAGHPLAEAAKGWYHEFSAAEIRKFPHLAVEPGTHRKPAGHVKTAVVHRLARILAEAGAEVPEIIVPAPRRPAPCETGDEPEPEVTPAEQLEAELWHLVSDAADVDRLLALAQRAYAVSGS